MIIIIADSFFSCSVFKREQITSCKDCHLPGGPEITTDPQTTEISSPRKKWELLPLSSLCHQQPPGIPPAGDGNPICSPKIGASGPSC